MRLKRVLKPRASITRTDFVPIRKTNTPLLSLNRFCASVKTSAKALLSNSAQACWIGGHYQRECRQCTMQFHASAVDSGEYRVLLRSDAATDLLSAFSSMFSADSVQRTFLLKDKLGERIANPCISIIDDPFEEDNPRAFDAEGTPSCKNCCC